MRISMNVNNLTGRYDFARAAQIYKQAGFDALDYGFFGMVNDADIMNGDDFRTVAENIRKDADAVGITINQAHAPFSFRGWDNEENYRNVIFPRIVRSLEAAAIMGAEIIVVHPLHHLSYRDHVEELFQMNMDFYRSLIPYCREFGIQVGVENMWQTDPLRKHIVADTCSRSEEFVRYIDTLDSEFMVACLDVGHVGLPAGAEEEAQDVIRALGHDRLKALHIHDNDYRADLHTLPFLGKMNWVEITRALKDIRYTGDFTYEVGAIGLATAPDDYIPIGAEHMYNVAKYLVSQIEE